MDLEGKKLVHMLLLENGENLQNDLMCASNFEGDGLHLNLLIKLQFFGSNSFLIHITCYGKVTNFL